MVGTQAAECAGLCWLKLEQVHIQQPWRLHDARRQSPDGAAYLCDLEYAAKRMRQSTRCEIPLRKWNRCSIGRSRWACYLRTPESERDLRTCPIVQLSVLLAAKPIAKPKPAGGISLVRTCVRRLSWSLHKRVAIGSSPSIIDEPFQNSEFLARSPRRCANMYPVVGHSRRGVAVPKIERMSNVRLGEQP